MDGVEDEVNRRVNAHNAGGQCGGPGQLFRLRNPLFIKITESPPNAIKLLHFPVEHNAAGTGNMKESWIGRRERTYP